MPAPKPGFFRDLLNWFNPKTRQALANTTGQVSSLRNKLDVIQKADNRIPPTNDASLFAPLQRLIGASKDPAAKAVGSRLVSLNAEVINARRALHGNPTDPKAIAALQAAKQRQAAYHAKVLQENPALRPLVDTSKSLKDNELLRTKLEAPRTRFADRLPAAEAEVKALSDSLTRGKRNAKSVGTGAAGTLAALGLSGHSASRPAVGSESTGSPREAPSVPNTATETDTPLEMSENVPDTLKTLGLDKLPVPKFDTSKALDAKNIPVPAQPAPALPVKLKDLANNLPNSSFREYLDSWFRQPTPTEKPAAPPVSPSVAPAKPSEAATVTDLVPNAPADKQDALPPTPKSPVSSYLPYLLGGAGLGLGAGAYYLGQDAGSAKKKKRKEV